MTKALLPPTLEKGDTIGIFSSSCPMVSYAPKAAENAVDFIEQQGFHIKKGSLWGKREHYRTGSIKERADEFNSLLHDKSVKCLMASIGGFVSNSILPYIDYDYFAENPKVVVGMSDVTSLLMGLYAKTGVTVYYGTNLIGSYARDKYYNETAFECFINAVNNRTGFCYPKPEFYSDETIDDRIDWTKPFKSKNTMPNKMITLNGGKASGRLIGGNLNTLTSVWGSEYMPEIKNGDILFIENVEESADYVERYISWLKLNGIFEKIGGLIIGKHRNFNDLNTNKKPYEILTEVIGTPDFPILADFDCSHTAPMLTMPIGVEAELDADAQTLRLKY